MVATSFPLLTMQLKIMVTVRQPQFSVPAHCIFHHSLRKIHSWITHTKTHLRDSNNLPLTRCYHSNARGFLRQTFFLWPYYSFTSCIILQYIWISRLHPIKYLHGIQLISEPDIYICYTHIQYTQETRFISNSIYFTYKYQVYFQYMHLPLHTVFTGCPRKVLTQQKIFFTPTIYFIDISNAVILNLSFSLALSRFLLTITTP